MFSSILIVFVYRSLWFDIKQICKLESTMDYKQLSIYVKMKNYMHCKSNGPTDLLSLFIMINWSPMSTQFVLVCLYTHTSCSILKPFTEHLMGRPNMPDDDTCHILSPNYFISYELKDIRLPACII